MQITWKIMLKERQHDLYAVQQQPSLCDIALMDYSSLYRSC